MGLCVGSFLNVVIYRVPIGLSVAKPASHCPSCKAEIKWYDNIPVLSYIILRGKCRNCKCHIPIRYTVVEIANAILWILCLVRFYSYSLVYAFTVMAALTVMVCVFFIDLEHKLIFDRFQIIFAVTAIIAAAVDIIKDENGGRWISHLFGCAAAFAIFMLLAFIGEKIAGREALGGGDIKLFTVMGLFLGWEKLLLAALVASLSASIIILVYKSLKKSEEREIPFAPFLTSGFAVAVLFGDSMINWYISFLTNI